MSGEKSGVAAGAGVATVASPIVATAALVGIGGAALGMAAHGVWRLGQKAYEKIDRQIAEKINKDLLAAQQRVIHYRERIQEENLAEDDRENLPAVTSLKMKIEHHEQTIGQIEIIARERRKFEARKNLSDQISRDFEQQITQLRRKQAAQKALLAQVKQQGGDEVDRLILKARNKAAELEPYYPDLHTEYSEYLNRAGSGQDRNPDFTVSRLRRLIKNIDIKIAASRTNTIPLMQISAVFRRLYSQDYLTEFMDKEEQEGLIHKMMHLRESLESGVLDESAFNKRLEDLQQDVDELSRQCGQRAEIKRFDDHMQVIKDTMSARGYSSQSVPREKNGSIFLDYFQTDPMDASRERKVRMVLKGPSAAVEGTRVFQMVVDRDGFQDERQREAEGKAIARDLMSSGLPIDLEETAQLINAMLKERLDETYGDVIRIKTILDLETYELSNGSLIRVDPTIDPEKQLDTIISQITPNKVKEIHEKKAIRESH